MSQFDYYSYESGFLLDVQADLMSGLATRVVVPLHPLTDAPKPAKDLNPAFTIGTNCYVMLTQFLASVPKALLKNPVGSLAKDDLIIKSALDMLFDGI